MSSNYSVCKCVVNSGLKKTPQISSRGDSFFFFKRWEQKRITIVSSPTKQVKQALIPQNDAFLYSLRLEIM